MRGMAVATIVASIAPMKVAIMIDKTTSGRRLRRDPEGMALLARQLLKAEIDPGREDMRCTGRWSREG